jgi:hypothetical protein
MKSFKNYLNEMGAAAAGGGSAGPTNVVSGGAIAGTGGKGGEPGVDMRKRIKHNPILMKLGRSNLPK